MHTDLAHRSFEPELLDGGDYTDAEYVQCMRQLRLINVLTHGYRPTLKALAHFSRLRHSQRLSVLDAGFGYGDTLRAVARWAAKRGIKVELTGIDLNGRSAEIAREATPAWMPIRYIAGNIFTYEPARPFDVVINSLFMHHMNEEQTVRVMRWMAGHSTLGFAINDLHRHRLAYEFIRIFTRVFGFNRMIRNDAPLSVARAFRAEEWRGYAAAAGLDVSRLSVKGHWPFRFGVRYEHAR